MQDNHDRSLMELMITTTQISRSYKAACDKVSAQFGLTQAIAWPIVAISRMGDGIRPGVVAEAIGIEPSSVVRVLDLLADANLIERRDDINDRRARLLYLTEKGRQKVAQIEQALLPLRHQLLDGITEAELDICMHVFQTLGKSIERHKNISK